GYSGDFNAELVNWIKSQPEVEYVNKQVRHSANALQSDAPWGLTRISSAKKYTDAVKGEYRYVSETGQGVDVYVLDTGINFKHIDFEGRARWGKTFAENSTDDDVHGHGTHVAGTIAGRKYGVSKGANVIAVKVLGDDGYGSTEEVVAGIEWVVKNPPRWGTPIKGKVINMSLGGDLDLALNEAVNKAVDAGVHIVVAAGNESTDACTKSPASAEKAITVGATTIDDTLAYFSNYGKCVDILAPGRYILSAWIGSNQATKNISGTSMASPHVAGIVADYISLDQVKFTPETLSSKLTTLSNKNAIANLPKDTPNLLARN
ncbi:subtilisin-like protein, partial [Neoconidiobolus thromboides FSU 785]